MKIQIAQIENLIIANKSIKVRTPFLEAALGGLQTAVENTKEHVTAAAKLMDQRAAELKKKQEELEKAQNDLADQKAAAAKAESGVQAEPPGEAPANVTKLETPGAATE